MILSPPVVSGRTGSSKSYIICALGNSACRHLYRIKYFRIPELLLEIEDARSQGKYLKFMRGLQKIRLLILDDIRLKTYTVEESRDISEIAKARYNKSSTYYLQSAQVEHSR